MSFHKGKATMNKKLKEVCQRLVDAYVMNKDSDSEFIACRTPSRNSIGAGGVWDDWKILDGLLNEPDPKFKPRHMSVYRSNRTGKLLLCIDAENGLFLTMNRWKSVSIEHDQLVLLANNYKNLREVEWPGHIVAVSAVSMNPLLKK